jgi:hypothetical protein
MFIKKINLLNILLVPSPQLDEEGEESTVPALPQLLD